MSHGNSNFKKSWRDIKPLVPGFFILLAFYLFFTKLFSKITGFDGETSFTIWCFGVAFIAYGIIARDILQARKFRGHILVDSGPNPAMKPMAIFALLILFILFLNIYLIISSKNVEINPRKIFRIVGPMFFSYSI